MIMNITIGIPAYNEEKNIGKLIDEILSQDIGDNIMASLIISDSSTDRTEEIVSSYIKKNKNINLIRTKVRQGKSQALNLIFRAAQKDDVLILLDADVLLGSNTLKFLLERILRSEDIGLVGGNPVPVSPKSFLNIAEQASFFSWAILTRMKDISPYGLYHSHGRILAISKQFCSNISIPNTVHSGDDQYLYLSCIKNGLKFEYEPKAVVFYKLPKTIGDYLKQGVRFRRSIIENKKLFGNNLVEDHMNVKNKFSIFLTTFMHYPYKGLCWIILYTILKTAKITEKSNVSSAWEVSESTK